MALSVLVRLRDGRYDAATVRPTVAEWPPHPARVFCALVASAVEPADWAVLQWLETVGPPQVCASPFGDVRVARAAGYVVTNATQSGGGSQTWPGRSNGYKHRAGAFPSDDEFALVWPEAEPDDATLGRLVRLARRVPYIGRSTSSAELSVLPEAVALRPTWVVYRPTALDAPRAVELRVPYAGYLDALRAGYEWGQRAWDFSRAAAYVVKSPVEKAPDASRRVHAGPYPELLVWGIERPSASVSGDRVLAVTDALRRAVISRVADPVPPLVSGHQADGQPHVAYLGLLHVDHEHADGHLLGVALAIPDRLTGDDRRRLLRALLDERDPLTTLRLPWNRELTLSYQPERTAPRGLVPERWTGGSGGARRWVTITPVMLERYPHRRDDPAQLIAQSLVTAGYPEPSSVEVLPVSPIRGGVHRPRRATLPEGRPMRPRHHCRVEFPAPVAGPVIAGSLRYLGVGLFIPQREQGGATDADSK
jgi:CRISPR-associated protein Csb2